VSIHDRERRLARRAMQVRIALLRGTQTVGPLPISGRCEFCRGHSVQRSVTSVLIGGHGLMVSFGGIVAARSLRGRTLDVRLR
jgi:hypothetical protein